MTSPLLPGSFGRRKRKASIPHPQSLGTPYLRFAWPPTMLALPDQITIPVQQAHLMVLFSFSSGIPWDLVTCPHAPYVTDLEGLKDPTQPKRKLQVSNIRTVRTSEALQAESSSRSCNGRSLSFPPRMTSVCLSTVLFDRLPGTSPCSREMGEQQQD